MKYYVYAYLDPRKPCSLECDGFSYAYEPFYIGKGSGSRDFEHLEIVKSGNYQNNPRHTKIAKILKEGKSPIIIRLQEGLTDEDAYLLEYKVIKGLGRVGDSENKGPLVNLTDGGTGMRNANKEIREKISKTLSGTIYSDERKASHRQALLSAGCAFNFRSKVGNFNGKNNPMYGKDRSGFKNPATKFCYFVVKPDNSIDFVLGLGKYSIENGYGEWALRHSGQKFLTTGKPYKIERSDTTEGFIVYKFLISNIGQSNVSDLLEDNQQLSLVLAGLLNLESSTTNRGDGVPSSEGKWGATNVN